MFTGRIADLLQGRTELTGVMGTKPTTDDARRATKSVFRHCLVHEQNGDIVAHRIHAPALAALQAFAVFFLRQRLLAHRANQDFEKLLGNHARILRQFHSTESTRRWAPHPAESPRQAVLVVAKNLIRRPRIKRRHSVHTAEDILYLPGQNTTATLGFQTLPVSLERPLKCFYDGFYTHLSVRGTRT